MRSFVEWLYDSVPHSLLLSYSRHSFMGLKRGPDIIWVQSVLFLIGDCKVTLWYFFLEDIVLIGASTMEDCSIAFSCRKSLGLQGWFQGTQMASGCLLKSLPKMCSRNLWLYWFSWQDSNKKTVQKKTDPSLNRSIGAQWAQGSTKRCAQIDFGKFVGKVPTRRLVHSASSVFMETLESHKRYSLVEYD